MNSSEENSRMDSQNASSSANGGDGTTSLTGAAQKEEVVTVPSPAGNSNNHNTNGNKNDDNDDDKQDGTTSQKRTPQRKRGMKPRSKRNRKRPKSQLQELEEQEEQTFETRICRLELEGRPIETSTGCSWLRVVEPYPYTFSTFAKARWIGRTVLDVYHDEFGSYPRSYYATAIQQGRILVSDHKVNDTYLIKGGDVLTHTVHRHEPGVAVYSDQAPFVRVVEESPDVLVIDKPGTLPIHPCGGYHVQSLMKLLEEQFGKLYTIHRLDRLTSGLVILGKTSPVAQVWGKCIMQRECQKVYLARVTGKFPLNCPQDLSSVMDADAPLPVPVNGEWGTPAETGTGTKQKKKVLSEEDAAASVGVLRQRNARGYWITDMDGSVQADMGLSQVFDRPCDAETWLQQLATRTTKKEGAAVGTASTTTTTIKEARNDMLWFHLACPTRVAQHKDGICETGAFEDLDATTYLKTVKSAQTSFGVVKYDADTDSTIVLCRPTTGRTHQIRLHLQHLGHPIANDPNYGGSLWFSNPIGQRASERAKDKLDALNTANEQEIQRLTQGKAAVGVDDYPPIASTTMDETSASSSSFQALDVPATEAEIQKGVCQAVRQDSETIHDFIRRTCVWCARSRQVTVATSDERNHQTEDRTSLEFLIRSPGIWLHALQYSFGLEGKTMVFRTALPSWAVPSPSL